MTAKQKKDEVGKMLLSIVKRERAKKQSTGHTYHDGIAAGEKLKNTPISNHDK